MLNNVNNHKQLGALSLKEKDGGRLALNKQLASCFDSEGREEGETLRKQAEKDDRFHWAFLFFFNNQLD